MISLDQIGLVKHLKIYLDIEIIKPLKYTTDSYG